MAAMIDLLIHYGSAHYHDTALGSSIGLTAFGLMIIVAAFECRSVLGTVLRADTFDNRTMNLTALGVFALVLGSTQMDIFERLLGTEPLKAGQFGLALSAAVLLFALWELGKLVARRRSA
jgi:Ca2+-transporting ATPase